MPKQHWTQRFDMQIARETVAQRARGMLLRSGMLNDIDVLDARRIRVGLPEGFDLLDRAVVYRFDKIVALCAILGVGYTIEASDELSSIVVCFHSS